MAFEEGNEYYKIRSKDGRDKIFATPSDLSEACNKYFQFILENPFKVDNLFAFQGQVTHEDSTSVRVMSLEGMCNYLDIHVDTWKLYEKRTDFIGVTKRARQIIDSHQFENAAANLVNANIIARKLGLADNQKVTNISEQPLFPES